MASSKFDLSLSKDQWIIGASAVALNARGIKAEQGVGAVETIGVSGWVNASTGKLWYISGETGDSTPVKFSGVVFTSAQFKAVEGNTKAWISSGAIRALSATTTTNASGLVSTMEELGSISESGKKLTLLERSNVTTLNLAAGGSSIDFSAMTGVKTVMITSAGVTAIDTTSTEGREYNQIYADSKIYAGEGKDTYKDITPAANGTGLLFVEDAGGDDVYSIITSAAIVDKGDGNDTFNISTFASASVNIKSAKGTDTYNITNSLTSAGIKIEQEDGDAIISLKGTGSTKATLLGTAGNFSLDVKESGANIDATGVTNGSISASFASSATIALNNKDNVINITDSGSNGVTLSAGAGKNTVSIASADKLGKVVASGLTGDNSFYVSDGTKKFDISGGKGADSYFIGSNTSGKITEVDNNTKNFIQELGSNNDITFAAGSFDSIEVKNNENKLRDLSDATVIVSGNKNLLAAKSGGKAVTFSIAGGEGNSIDANNNVEDTINLAGDIAVSLKVDSKDSVNFTGTNDTISLVGPAAATTTVTVGGTGNHVVWSKDNTGTGAFSIGGADAYVENASSGKATVTVAAGSSNASVVGGEDADTFTIEGSFASIAGGKGKDVYDVTKDGVSGTINNTGGADEVNISGKNVTITGDGSEGIKYTVAKEMTGANITAGDGKDTVVVNASDAVVSLGAGNDSVFFAKEMTGTVSLGGGVDTVNVEAGATVTIDDLSLADGDILKLANNGSSSANSYSYDESTGYTTIKIAKDNTTLVLKGQMAELKGISTTGSKTIKNLFEDSLLPATDTKSSDKTVELDQFKNDSIYAYVDGENVAYTGSTDKVSILGTGENNSYIAEPNAKGQTINGGKLTQGWAISGTFNGDSIVGGTGNDTIKGNGGKDTIDGGAGKDYIYATTGSVINTGDGADTVDATALTGTATLAKGGFNADEDVIVVNDMLKVEALNGGLKVGDNATITGTGEAEFFNVKTPTGKVTRYGTVPSTTTGESSLDTAATTKDSEKGNQVAKFIRDNGQDNYIYGGAKNDTIVAGKGDSIWGAAGKDSIVLDNTKGTSEKVGLVADSGRDSVSGFETGFGENNDAIYFFNGDYMNLGETAINKGALTFKVNGNDSSITLADKDFSGTGAYVRVQDAAHHGDEAVNIAIGHGSNSSIALGNDGNGNWANVYYNGPVDFSSYDEGSDLFVDLDGRLGGTTKSFYGFYGVSSLKGSDAVDSKLAGSGAANNTLVGGASGKNSLWGGSGTGNDSLVGNDNSEDTFYFDTDCGNDTISGAGANDKVMFYNSPSSILTNWDNGSKVASFSNGSTLTFNGIQAGFQAQFANGTHTYKEDGTWDWKAKA